MKEHLSNALFGVLDYAAHPAAMLLAAPFLLRHLGIAQYGVWVVSMAAVSIGGILASGFGDANIQNVASMRALGQNDSLLRTVRSILAINMVLGGTLMALFWILIPWIVRHVVPSDTSLAFACTWSLRIAALLMPIRAVESVCISTQRAFERYGAAVRISIFVRLLTIAAAVALALCGFGVIGIMAGTALLMLLGTLVQLFELKQHLKANSLWPSFDRQATKALFEFGVFSWIQALSSVLFAQADRLILGISLGATAVTAYALSSQIAQPIYGIAAAGLHFLFPYLTRRRASTEASSLRRTIFIALGMNVILVLAETAAAFLFSRFFLKAWVGAEIATNIADVFAPIVWSFALLGLSVTAYYALLALGHFRTVTWLNLAGGAAMLLFMFWLIPAMGVRGAATSRLCFGVVSLGMYLPLLRLLRRSPQNIALLPGSYPVCEEA